jgi:hypothetical protein
MAKNSRRKKPQEDESAATAAAAAAAARERESGEGEFQSLRERERERDKRTGFWLALLFVCTFCVCGVKFRFITGEHFPIVFKYFRVSFSFGV